MRSAGDHQAPTTVSIAHLLEFRIPYRLDESLQNALGVSMPRTGMAGRYGIVASGRFRGALTADLMAFTCNNQLDAALVIADEDTERVLYFEHGHLVGAMSTVLFERLARILYNSGAVDREAYEGLIEIEEEQGPSALLDWVPAPALTRAAQQRVWEVVAGLYVVNQGHFILVEGSPQLDQPFRASLDPMQVALEGLRRHDQWRNGPRDDAEDASAQGPLPRVELIRDINKRLRPVRPKSAKRSA
ncbi:MAG: DUF4388 domain-containing protein [Planctomycetota bacterium]|nr:DUF4388 domain-containing protein [Planctomycetota bacterium]